MAKIPFDIKFRPQIESGEYKVITAKEQPVRIICWDRSTTYWKIIALVLAPDGKTENPFTYDVEGKESDGCLHDHELDLFLITPEPELTDFEKCVKECLEYDPEVVSDGDLLEATKEYAKELLATARKELQPEIDAEVEKAYKNADRMQYEKGREDALKDRPTWKKCEDGNTDRLELEALCREAGSPIEIAFRANGYRIFLTDLEVLPKEEEQ